MPNLDSWGGDEDKTYCEHCGKTYELQIGPPGHICAPMRAAWQREELAARGRPIPSHPVPKVGDTVTLNHEGLQRCFGSAFGLSHMLSKRMKITHVDPESMTAPEKTYLVNVDDPEINMLMIDHWLFDIVRP